MLQTDGSLWMGEVGDLQHRLIKPVTEKCCDLCPYYTPHMDISTGKPKLVPPHTTSCVTQRGGIPGEICNQILVGETASYKQWLEKRTAQSSSSLHWGPGTPWSMAQCKFWWVSPWITPHPSS